MRTGSMVFSRLGVVLLLGALACSGCAAAKYHAKKISPFHDTEIEKAQKKVKKTGKKLDQPLDAKKKGSGQEETN